MNALAELQKRARPSANPANPANLRGVRATDSQDSQDSQGSKPKKHTLSAVASAPTDEFCQALKDERFRLLELAALGWIDEKHVHRLPDPDVAGCIGLGHSHLTAFLSMLEESAERHAGRVPYGHTAAIHCRHCGPVWAHPAIADALPVVSGWPRALGCPWCFVRKAGGYIPRPPVACSDCQHFTPDPVNPEAGMGACGLERGAHWAGEPHPCDSHLPADSGGSNASTG